MRMLTTWLIGTVVIGLTVSSPAFAQDRHAIDPATIAGTLTQHVADEEVDRAAIREALARPEVKDVAGKTGLDLSRAAAVVETMSGPELQRAAGIARDVNGGLVGGASSVTLSTTTLIVILLVVILIIVAVK